MVAFVLSNIPLIMEQTLKIKKIELSTLHTSKLNRCSRGQISHDDMLMLCNLQIYKYIQQNVDQAYRGNMGNGENPNIKIPKWAPFIASINADDFPTSLPIHPQF